MSIETMANPKDRWGNRQPYRKFNHRFFNSVLNEIYVFDAKTFCFVEVNKGARQNLGYTMDDLRGLAPWDLKPEISEPRFREMVDPLLDGETEVLRFETVHRRKDGSVYPVEVHLQLFADEVPNVFVAIIIDTTNRKEAEDLSQRLGRILEASLNEIYVFDAKSFCFVQVNEGARRNLGYTMDELRGLAAWDLKPEISEPRFRKMVDPLLDGETEVLRFETVHRRKDGSVYPVEVHLQLFAEETPAVFVAIILDITAMRAAQEEQRKLALIAERTSNGIAIADSEGRLEWVNQAYVELTGYTLEEIKGRTPGSFLHGAETDRAVVAKFRQELMAGKVAHAELLNSHKNGRTYWVDVHIQPLCRPDGTVEKYVAVQSDITERKRAESAIAELNQQLAREKERYELAVRGSADGLWDWDIPAGEVFYSPRCFELLGYASDESPHTFEWFGDQVHPDDVRRAGAVVEAHLHNHAPYDLQYRLRHKNGSYIWFRARGQAVWDEAGKPTRMAGSISDISSLKRSEEAIKRLAEVDPLTALPNRMVFQRQLDVALKEAVQSDAGVGVILLDLDDFKGINDTLGHTSGDALLREVGSRVLGCVRSTDTLARLGGDEFIVVVPKVSSRLDVEDLANRIISSLAVPFNLFGQEVYVGTSIGIAIYPDNTANRDDLLRNADLALYRAKEQGRGAYCFYEEKLSARLQARQSIEADLRRALATDQLELHYQPLVEVEGHKLTGVEALMRWRHPERGMISPAEFIPVAESTGLIVPLGEWAIKEACSVAAAWPDNIKVAVNLSPVQFKREGLDKMVASALATSGMSASRLELEITESVLLDHSAPNLDMLHRLRRLGVRIALDDFGTGYSSLSYLQSFPFDKIKIDHSFVKNITVNKDSIKIVRAIVMLAHSLNMTTTAEGVETEEQLDAVRFEGCDEIQGYFFSPPQPAWEIERRYIKNPKVKRALQERKRVGRKAKAAVTRRQASRA
jgi:diguanylate cyclase (GGDEF)-like protein/PAS domain S-box-containing protein